MYTVGMLVACTLYVNITYNDIPFKLKDTTAYGYVNDIHYNKLSVDFTEFTSTAIYTEQNRKPIGDYSNVLVDTKECIPMEKPKRKSYL